MELERILHQAKILLKNFSLKTLKKLVDYCVYVDCTRTTRECIMDLTQGI